MPKPSPLKAVAAARGMTLRDVAERAGYSPGTVRAVSNGTVAAWPEFRRRIAEVFGTDPFAAEVPSDAA
jgi:transcriptional regulator with XRE-family HTH domain